MAESFLEEQLKRIRALSERMSQVRSEAAAIAQARARDRELANRDPLTAVRDYRPYPGNDAESPRRSTSRDASSRRRK